MAVETIDDVIKALDAIIERARADESRLGYFAALYRRITRAVKDGIAGGRFRNGPLVEWLDVVFAKRYLDAFDLFRSGQPPSSCWRVAFEAAGNRLPLVVQQLLVGINAHINLDLGIASAAVSPGGQLPALQADFDLINAVLAEQVGAVEKEVAVISPLIGLLEKLGMRTETRIINFSLDKARDFAWTTAEQLAATPPPDLPAAIAQLDAQVALLGIAIVHPPLVIEAKLAPIRLEESNDIRKNLDVLAGI